jgi:hypothetical protein
VLAELGLPAVPDTVKQLDQVLKEGETAIASIPEKGHLAEQLAQARQSALSLVSNAEGAAANSAKDAWERFNFWFEAIQDRAEQWFAAQARVFTILFAILSAIIFQLDTVEIYPKVSSDGTLRNRLVASAATFTADAEKVLTDSTTILQDTLLDWLKSVNEQDNASLSNETKAALAALRPQPSETRASFVTRLHEILSPVPNGAHLEQRFVTKLTNQATDRLKQEAQDFAMIEAGLDQTSFPLLTSPFNRWHPDDYWSGVMKYAMGILISAALLSLGAPFWFNILKGLAGLRSMVARNISKEPEIALRALNQSNGQITPPPTMGLHLCHRLQVASCKLQVAGAWSRRDVMKVDDMSRQFSSGCH